MSSSLKPFFVHIPKNMGTFIYEKFYNSESDTKFYGLYDSIEEYAKKHTITHNILNNTKQISIDHLTPFELLRLGILTEEECKAIFFLILREPVKRFISLCNYWDISPDTLIYNITKIDVLKKTRYNLFQHFRPQSDYIHETLKVSPNLRIFSMDNKTEIIEFLKENFPEKNVDFSEKIYASTRLIYTISSLTEKHMNFIHDYYREDFVWFNKTNINTRG